MNRWMMCVAVLMLVLSAHVTAQQDGSANEKEWKEPAHVKVGGAGGVIVSLGLFKNEEIDKTLKSIGMPGLGSDPMVLVGGEGYGYIMFLPNLRLGGYGTGGKQTVSVLDASNVKKNIDYHVTYGGFLIDYVVPVVHHLDIAGGFTIGSSTIEIVMSRDDGSFKRWGDLWTEFGNNNPTKNVTRSLSGTFVAFNPHLNIEYSLLTWMQVRIGVGYPMLFNANWQMNDTQDIQNVPSNLKPDGININGGVMFGFFN